MRLADVVGHLAKSVQRQWATRMHQEWIQKLTKRSRGFSVESFESAMLLADVVGYLAKSLQLRLANHRTCTFERPFELGQIGQSCG